MTTGGYTTLDKLIMLGIITHYDTLRAFNLFVDFLSADEDPNLRPIFGMARNMWKPSAKHIAHDNLPKRMT
jgi:hypothetical protein